MRFKRTPKRIGQDGCSYRRARAQGFLTSRGTPVGGDTHLQGKGGAVKYGSENLTANLTATWADFDVLMRTTAYCKRSWNAADVLSFSAYETAALPLSYVGVFRESSPGNILHPGCRVSKGFYQALKTGSPVRFNLSYR